MVKNLKGLLYNCHVFVYVACLKGYYKSPQGNDLCEKCPDNSNCNTSGTTSCTCLTGYYRSRYEDVSSACMVSILIYISFNVKGIAI